MNKVKALITWSLAVVVPLTFLVLWKLNDNRFPNNDEGFYAVISQEIYLTYKAQGIAESVKFAYFHKHWKPILHPVIGALFLTATEGNVRRAISLYNICVYGLLLTFFFFYFRRQLTTEATILATTFVALIPWCYGLTTNFNSEIGFLAATIGFWISIEGKEFYTSWKSAVVAALCFSLMACLRPVETGLIFSVLSLYSIFQSLKSKIIKWRDLIVLAYLIFYFIAAIVPPYFYLGRNWNLNEIGLLVGVSFFNLIFTLSFSKKFNLNKSFQLFWGMLFFISTSWFVPGALTLFDWIIGTNFGTMAIETGNRVGRPTFEFVIFYLTKLGAIPWILLCITFVSSRIKGRKMATGNLIVFLIGAILFPLYLGSRSHNGDVRYYYAGWLIAVLYLTRIALDHKQLFYRLRFLGIVSLATILLLNLLILNNRNFQFMGFFKMNSFLGQSFFDLESKKTDHLQKYFDQIANSVSFPSQKLGIFIMKNVSPSYPPLDSHALILIAREKHWFWNVITREVFDSNTREYLISELNERYDYVLAGPLDSSWAKNKTEYQKIGGEFQEMCRLESKREGFNFKFERIINFVSAANLILQYCLFRNTAKEPNMGPDFN